jgi:hypothetical protein
LQAERDAWERALNYVGANRLGIGGVTGPWSARDIVAHIMTREQHLADRLHEVRQGECLPPCRTVDELDTFLDDFGYPDFESPAIDALTADEWAIQKYRNTPFNDIVALELHTYGAILDNIKLLSEQQLESNGLYERIARVTIAHYRRHAADIRKHFNAPLRP